jgi:hypothetical protein
VEFSFGKILIDSTAAGIPAMTVSPRCETSSNLFTDAVAANNQC